MRTVVASVIPQAAVSGKFPLLFSCRRDLWLLYANVCSFAFDYAARQKIGGVSLSMFVMKQLPVLPPSTYSADAFWSPGVFLRDWLKTRVLELTYTAWDLVPFAQECEWHGPPFKWDEERRFVLRCEMDAAFFHLYLPADSNGGWRAQNETADDTTKLKTSFCSPRDAVSYILDSFPIVRRKDEQRFGEYHTKRVILEIYDAMAGAERTSVPYQTRLDPPPSDPRCCHPQRKVGILAFGSLINDPGPELAPKVIMRIKTQTPFPVEYGRFSGRTRGGAPTLVPHCKGAPVRAEILVLHDDVSVSDARDMLSRRERHKEGSGNTYVEGTTPDSVLVRPYESPWVATVLYTDFWEAGKIADPTPGDLATHAIQSVPRAAEGKDGITYLRDAVASGIQTSLTAAYTAEILRQTQATSLEEAICKARKPICTTD